MAHFPEICGAGLGLKRELIPQLQAMHGQSVVAAIDFLEIAPENWIGVGGQRGRQLSWLADHYPIAAHGLSLSLGGPDPLNEDFLRQVKAFLDRYRISLYTEHLSYCTDGGYLYDLLPIPFTQEAVKYVAARIRRTQEILERRIAVENASFYVAAPIAEMDELTFIKAVLEEADCDLHLDINNVYVNSVNFGFDPHEFLHGIPDERIVYAHIAGHDREAEDLIIDTHGQDVIDPVWALLKEAYSLFGVFPTLLERDIDIPPLPELMKEVDYIAELQGAYSVPKSIASP
ncbi:MAG TPA: DUF692 domain-containing protein [Methylophilaceae bacterium]|nr:DUF692 domain-containing protein [Methylophilaceae bacterium]